LNRRHAGDKHLLGAEKMSWPVHENRLAPVAAGFSLHARQGRWLAL
jgi:hypothetical protein